MTAKSNIQSGKAYRGTLLRAGVVGFGMMAVTVLAFASKGGGDKKKGSEFNSPFTPINSASTFSLRRAPGMYAGSMTTLNGLHNMAETHVSLSPLITTYQKGNTTLILPFQYQPQMQRVPATGARSSLQLFGVKIQIPR